MEQWLLRARGGRKWGVSLMWTEFQYLWEDKTFWRWMVVMVAQDYECI